jgi:phosphoribosylformylglycinamidine synthase
MELGFEVDFEDDIRTDFLLFGEDQSRIVVTVAKEKVEELLNFFEEKTVPAKVVGIVTGTGRGVVKHKGREVINLSIKECKEIYENSLERKLTGEL